MRAALVAFVLVAGCAALPEDDPHCGEVQRRSDGAWFLPTVVASSSPPRFGVLVESELQREWEEAYERSSCGLAVREGEAFAWPGPVLRPNERDALDVVLFDRSADMNSLAREGPWTVRLAVEGDAVRVEPSTWAGEVVGDVHAAFLVEGMREGKAMVRVFVSSPYDDAANMSRFVDYVVNATATVPHRM